MTAPLLLLRVKTLAARRRWLLVCGVRQQQLHSCVVVAVDID